MAERLNHLFQTAPRQYLERIVLFTDALSSDESLAQMRNRSTHHIDLQPLKQRSRATLLSGLHQYRDAPLISYFVAPGNFTLIPKSDPPYRFVFLPEFACCRLLVQTEGADWLKLSVEEGLAGTSSPPRRRGIPRMSILLRSGINCMGLWWAISARRPCWLKKLGNPGRC